MLTTYTPQPIREGLPKKKEKKKVADPGKTPLVEKLKKLVVKIEGKPKKKGKK